MVGTEKSAIFLDFTFYLNMTPYIEKIHPIFLSLFRKLIAAMRRT